MNPELSNRQYFIKNSSLCNLPLSFFNFMYDIGKDIKIMRIGYNKLWKLLIDKNMNKNDLKATAGISSASVAKLGKGENITTDVLLKICE